MAEVNKTPLGPCRLYYDGQDLGYTSENVQINYSEDHAPINTAQTGTTNIDEILVGHTVEVEAELTRTQISVLASLMAGADNSDSSGDEFVVRNNVGRSLYDNAKELIIKPIVGNDTPSSNSQDWIIAYKTHPKTDLSIMYNNSDQRVFSFLFAVYPDLSNDGKLFGNVESA